MREMGMRNYDPSTIMFYEEELDRRPKEKIQSDDEEEEDEVELDYDIDLINELFDPEKPKFKVSYFHRPPH